jgi:spermidine/putrescine transport system permease protein
MTATALPRRLLGLLFATVVAIIYLPIVVMAIFSFSASRFQTLPFRDGTAEWYVRVFTDGQYSEGFLNSIFLASAVSVTATAIGFACA